MSYKGKFAYQHIYICLSFKPKYLLYPKKIHNCNHDIIIMIIIIKQSRNNYYSQWALHFIASEKETNNKPLS